jgi:beta-galactosidase
MGDIYTLNHYLNMLPLQEREEHLSEYVKSGEMPALSVEFGNLLFCDVLRGRNAFGGNRVSEPWLTEFAASYLGPQAYRNESTGYRSALRDNWQGGQNWQSWQGNAALHLDPNFIDLNALFIRHTWRSWRVWGYSGGMLPWDYHTHLFSLAKPAPTPAPPFVPGSRGAAPRSFFTQSLHYLSPAGGFTPHAAGLALFETNGPTLAWLAGPQDDFTDKDHSFRPGQQVVKSAALANDTRGPLDYSLTWRATLGGTSIASGKLAGRIDPARSLLLPIEFTLPATATGAKTDGTLTLEGSIGGRRHDDSFAFRMLAFPRQSPPDAVLLLDPAGETAAMFDRLGIAHEAWDAGKAAAAGRLLVIGRKALSGAANAPDPKVIEHFTREGGRVLLMAQDPDWLRSQLGLRVARFPVRRVFPVDPAHPLVADLDALDLRDWSGHGALIEAFPSYDPKVYARHGWRWGNRGSVSSAAIEKPHHAGWRPILECDFDLAYSPLMELDLEKGRVTLCTLDLEDHAAVDPVAEELARRIVRHAAAAPPAPRMETVYLGDDAGEAWLKSMGLVYRRAATLPPQSGLAILGRGHGIRSAAMQSWLEKGGRVFVSAAACDAAEPFPVTLEKSADFHGAGKVPAWPETAGLSLSDLRFRSGVPVSLLRPAAGIETGADGLLGRISISGGVAIISRLDPVALAADDRQWLRFTRWRHTRATAQILANLGATFRNDIRIFRPRLESIPLAGTWQEIVIQSLAAAPEPAKRHPHSPTSSRAAAAIANPPATAKPIEVPCELPAFRNADGEAVFFRTVTLPAEWAKQDAVLNLGVIDDYDEVFVNGRAVGRTTDRQPSSYSFKRVYPLSAGTLKPGENTIAVRVLDVFGGGGMMANPADLRLQLRSSHGQPTLYHPDYREDFELGDEPYRYYRW